MRIVSLLPAATEIVCALGLRKRLVGRSHECDFPEDVASLPILTRARLDTSLPSHRLDEEVRKITAARLPIYVLDQDRLAALRPDLVITQAACDVCAISYEQVLGSLRRTSSSSRVVSLQPTRLSEILEDLRVVAGASGILEKGAAFAAELQLRLESVAALMRNRSRLRVAAIEWLAPPMLAGHWVPEALTAAGAMPVGPAPGSASPYVTWEQIRSLEPDAIVVAPCGFDLPRTIAEATPFAARLCSLAPAVLLLDGNAYLNRPGPRIVEAVETIATWLRGEAVAPDRGVSWGAVPSRDSFCRERLDGSRQKLIPALRAGTE